MFADPADLDLDLLGGMDLPRPVPAGSDRSRDQTASQQKQATSGDTTDGAAAGAAAQAAAGAVTTWWCLSYGVWGHPSCDRQILMLGSALAVLLLHDNAAACSLQ